MKKKLIRITGILATIALLALIIFSKKGLLSSENDRSGFVSGRNATVLPVKAMRVVPAPLNDVLVAAGTVLADEEVEIAAEASGRITKIYFTEGRPVKAGELLATINNAELLAQAERNSFQLQLAQTREERQRQLLEKQGISQQTYDQVLTELNALRAEAALLQAQLDKTMIRAPFDGLLGLRYLSEGSYVSPGGKIVRLARINPVKLEFAIPERYAQYVKPGVQVDFKVDNSAETYTARIYAIEPVIDKESRSITARAQYQNTDGAVLPGSFAKVELPLLNLAEVLQVKAESLIPEMGKNKVFLYKNGKAEARTVATGIRTERMVQITEGLSEGDTVITSGLLQLRSGMEVELQNVDQP
ncbi:MAG: efflux RND transporter periplasmic adaptor subunit [Bacteroidales bacterium]|nr:efflux RND transporter periplasmic adaptor subunit [Bacteroidales bacterium]